MSKDDCTGLRQEVDRWATESTVAWNRSHLPQPGPDGLIHLTLEVYEQMEKARADYVEADKQWKQALIEWTECLHGSGK